ncbi:agmatine deiminase family protein [Spirosoma arcticum]
MACQTSTQQPAGSPAYRQVAEYEPTEAVWLLYPQVTHKKELPIEPVIATIIRAVAPYAHINLIVPNESLRQRASALLPDSLLATERVTLHTFPYQEFWARDMGPRFVRNANGQKAMADFRFNTWGYADTTDAAARLDEQLDERIAARLKLPITSSALITEGGDQEINRQGVLLAVQAVEKERNPSLSFEQIEAEFRRVLGAKKVIWLAEGLRDDDHTFRGPIDGPQGKKYYTTLTTNGHVDEVARFVNDSTILLAWIDPTDRHSPLERETGRRMDDNVRILRSATDMRGRPFRILRMQLPSPITTTLQPGDGVYDIISQLTYQDGSVFPVGKPVPVVAAASYLNFLIVNECVLVPYYWKKGRDPALRKQDADARRLLESLFPAKKVIPVDILPVNLGGGGIHCITANEPK